MRVRTVEHPILFSTPMVRAILDGRKTQTRRVIGQLAVCPYGGVGDRLWCRESFYVQPDLWAENHDLQPIHYKADAGLESYEDYILKPSIFMPRWASRITLEITAIRVERVQDIAYQDILDEGWDVSTSEPFTNRAAGEDAHDWYRSLWDSINAKRGYSWSSNPRVWVIEFKRLAGGGQTDEPSSGGNQE